jgi:hypothetical protein
MTVSADEQWIASARERIGRSGTWERDIEVIAKELRAESAERNRSEPALPSCPACQGHPPMRTFPRHELLTVDPLLFCGNCYGFWATGDALARGVADPGYVHPALEAVPAPRRCRSCMGHLKDDDSCRKCGRTAPALRCPQCDAPMERSEHKGVRLDHCAPCRGTWFDVGEIVSVYKLVPQQGLAMSTVDENAADNVPPEWWLAASVLARVFLPWLPL